MKISNETKVGVLAAVSITILILGYNFMKGEDLFSNSNTYYAVYQKVDGLFRSNPVVVNGYTVGHVNSVEMDVSNLDLIVGISVPSDIKIPNNSVFKITNNDLVGSKAIEIIMGDDSTGYAQSGDTLSSRKDAGIEQAITSVLTPLSEKVNNVLSNIDTAISDVSLQTTLNDLSATLTAFQLTTVRLNAILEGNTEKIGLIIDNVNKMSADLKESTPKVKDIIANLDQTSKDLKAIDLKGITKDLAATIQELKSTLEKLQSDDGTIGKLASSDELYQELMSTLHSVDSLANDVIKYPRRYTGITDGQRKKGDKQKEVNEGIKLPTETK